MVTNITTIKNMSATNPVKADEAFVMLQPKLAQFTPRIPAVRAVVAQLKVYADQHSLSEFLQDWEYVSQLLYEKWGTGH